MSTIKSKNNRNKRRKISAQEQKRQDAIATRKMRKFDVQKELEKALENFDLAAVRAAERKGASADYDDGYYLRRFANSRFDMDTQNLVFKFLLEDCNLNINSKAGHEAVAELMRENRHGIIKLFVQKGLDFNAPCLIQNKEDNTLFTVLATGRISNNGLNLMIEDGANPLNDGQKALKEFLTSAKFPFARMLLNNGANINLNDWQFLNDCLQDIADKRQKDTLSAEQTQRIVDFIMGENPDLTQNDFVVLRALDENENKDASQEISDRLYEIIAQKAAQGPKSAAENILKALEKDNARSDQTFGNLAASFDRIAADKKSMKPAIELLTTSQKNGIRPIDILTFENRLNSVFDPKLWMECEDDAALLMRQILPRYRSSAALAEIQMQKSLREKTIVTKPILKRRRKTP